MKTLSCTLEIGSPISRMGMLASLLVALVGISACAAAPDAVKSDVSSADKTSGWSLVWNDEFDADTLDRAKWVPEQSCWGGGNNERQCYTDRDANISQSDGVLRLKARREQFTGPMYPEGFPGGIGGTKTQEYTSGKLRTLGLAGWKYGRFSARIKLPAGQGTWPAFWMMPVENAYGNWPLSGELDIMEAVNLGTPCEDCGGAIETRTSGALHFGDKIPDNSYLFAHSDMSSAPGPHEEWRVYTVEWGEGLVQWFVDDKIFLRLTADDWFSAAPEAQERAFAPFDQPFYLMMNLAVGGNLAEKQNGRGFDEASYPAELLVDWVRVEQCADDPETGLACMSDAPWSGTPEGPWEVQAR